MSKFRLTIFLGIMLPGIAISQTVNQGLVNNGARIVITNGSNIYVNGSTGHYTSQNGGLINNSTSGGILTLIGNWVNNSSNTGFNADGATVVLNSSSAQTIGGTNASAFYRVTGSGNGTKTVNTAASISNLLSVGTNTTFNSNGNVTLLASATSNANVAALPSGASVTGNVNVQSYFTGGTAAHRGTRIVSSPVNETNLATKTYAQLKSYMVITGPGGAGNQWDVGATGAPNAVTLNKYNESATMAQSQFTPVAALTETLAPGNAALLFYRGNRSGYTTGTASTSNKVNAPYTIPESQTIQYTGPINQGNITVNLSYTNNSGDTYNGYNLVGNPYPAVIDWESVTRTNVNNELKFIKAGGGYVTYFNNGLAVIISPADATYARYIQPGQGFYTRATGSGASVTFTENAKSVSSTPGRLLYNSNEDRVFLSSGDFTPAKTIRTASVTKLLRMTLSDNVNKEETVAAFESGKSSTATFEDAIFFGGSTVSLSTLSSDNVKLTINFMPEVTASSELKLSVNSTSSGEFKLNFTDLSALDNYDVYLKDNYLNTSVDVKSAKEYSFNMDRSIVSSYGDNRLSLIISPPTTLPVTVSSFKAEKSSDGALLSWKTNSETNFAKFEIEKAIDVNTFKLIGEVNAKGAEKATTSYSFTDISPEDGMNYYRLKQIDNNGKFVYSGIASLNYSLNSDVSFTVYPNPVIDNVSVDLKRNGTVKLSIIDLSGRELKSRSFAKNEALQEGVADLPSGVYVIQIVDKESNVSIGKAKFIKK